LSTFKSIPFEENAVNALNLVTKNVAKNIKAVLRWKKRGEKHVCSAVKLTFYGLKSTQNQNLPKMNVLLKLFEFKRNERKYFTMIVALIATKSGRGIRGREEKIIGVR